MYKHVYIIVSLLVALCMGALRIEDIQSPPRMIKQPTTTELLFQEAPTGNISHQPLIIECEAEAQGSHPDLTYFWKKNGKDVDILQDARVSLKPGNGTLVMNNPKASDAGIYQCFANNDLGTAVTSPIRVRKAFLDDFNDTAIINVTAEEGNHFKLECNAPLGWPKPQVIWMYRNASSNMSISSPRITVDPKGTLWFSNVTLRDDSGNGFLYLCGVISHFSQERRVGHGIRLTVEPRELRPTAPELLYSSIKKGGSLLGGSLELWCIFSGSPLPDITWLKDEESLKLIPEIILMNHNKTLRINNITYKDEGTYRCTGSNGIGSPVSREMDVVVQAAPYFTKEPQIISAAEDENVELECDTTGVPTPNISWLYNGQPLTYFLPHSAHIKVQGTTKIQFTKLKAEHRGNYGCNASNTHGNVYKDVYVNVVAIGAQITKDPQNVSTVQGSSVTLKCEAFGVPTPKVSWHRSGQELMNTSPYTLLASGELNITTITFAEAGDYTCRARNRYHTEEKIASIFVKNATRVIVPTKSITVSEGGTAFLNCSVNADPSLPLAIDWFKGNESISSLSDSRIVKMENNTLRIRHVTVKDGGIYSCTAKTELDDAAGDATLKVRTVPNPPEISQPTCSKTYVNIIWKQVQDVLTYSIEYSTSFKPNTWEVLENGISSIKDQFFVSLSPWVNYTFRVVAINELGSSQPSNSTVCSTEPNHPFKNPDNVTGRGNASNNLVISWTPMPQIDHNAPGFHYLVKWKANDSNMFQNVWNETVIKEWTTSELVITNLPTYKPYLFQVRAINDLGKSNSTAHPVLGFSGQDVPTEAPKEFRLLEEIDATTAKLRWKPVKNESIRGKFEGYKIQHWTDPGNVLEKRIAFDITETEIKSLTPLSVNYVRVRAFNTDHDGPPSPTLLIVTPEGTPGKVTNFTVRPLGTDSFYLQWEPPKKPNGVLIGYEIYYEKSNMVENIGDGPKTRRNPSITDPKRSTAKLAGLKAGIKYTVYISAKTRKGLGDEFIIEETTKKSPSTTINKPSFRWDFVQEGLETWSARIYWIPNFSKTGSAGPGSNFYVEYKESKSDGANWEHKHTEINEDFIDLNHLKRDETYLIRVVAINDVTKEFSDAISSDEIRGRAARREIDLLLAIGIVISIIVGIILLVIIVGCIVERIRQSRFVVEPLSYSIQYANESDNPAVSGTRFGPQFRRASSPKPAIVFESDAD